MKKIGYGMGDFGISIAYFAVGFFFVYYLTDIVGMQAWLAGLAFFIGKFWDGVNDPLFGILSDRTKSKYGRKRVYLLLGAIPFALSFIILWFVPNVNETLQFVYATIAILLYSTTYSVVVVPYMALVPVMSDDYNERTQITSIRAMLSGIGTIIGGVAAFAFSDSTETATGLRTFIFIFAIFTAISIIIAAISVRGIENKKEKEPFYANYKSYLKVMFDKEVFTLLLLKFFGALGTGSLTVVFPYLAAHILNNPSSSSIGIAIYVIIGALVTPIWNKLTHKFDKRYLLLFTNIFVAITLGLMSIFISDGATIIFYIGCLFFGIFISSYVFIPYSFVPDLVEYYKHKYNEGHQSIFFGLWMSAHQLGIGVAGLLVGIFLSLFNYDGNLDVQPSEAILGIRISFGLLPGLFLIIASLLLLKYSITRNKFQRIQSELSKND